MLFAKVRLNLEICKKTYKKYFTYKSPCAKKFAFGGKKKSRAVVVGLLGRVWGCGVI